MVTLEEQIRSTHFRQFIIYDIWMHIWILKKKGTSNKWDGSIIFYHLNSSTLIKSPCILQETYFYRMVCIHFYKERF